MTTKKRGSQPAGKKKNPTEWHVIADGEDLKVFQNEDDAIVYVARRQAVGGELPNLEIQGR